MKKWWILLVLLAFASPLKAQNVALPPCFAIDTYPAQVTCAEAPKPKAKRLDWPSVIAATVAANADAFSTMRGLSNGCHEANPLLGRQPSTQTLFVSTGLLAIGLVSMNYLAEHAERKVWRKISRGVNWYLAGLETTMAVRNLKVCG